ncbi:hypothetical protein BU23DRAFT_320151 [Bimuria novae-zelandiae CBS 107.79]|uniref:Sister chromatid cohesion acetyltransferas-like protein Eco1 n=1 Tax=Bimuria novae-zelandiae CBS 107.79 TaxID=1447943 RepID=A0A6A5VV57_9PLEO|nr:hypothetical protein BU23DRAFT_320151 [Bimuria novae-zelandiae CBS 107.79]
MKNELLVEEGQARSSRYDTASSWPKRDLARYARRVAPCGSFSSCPPSLLLRANMATLSAKKIIRTYSRQRKPSLYDEETQEPPAKRRRVASMEPDGKDEHENAQSVASTRESTAPPSSPKDAVGVFSDDAPRSSPPSSPVSQSCPSVQKRRPVFSFLKRQSNAKQPLAERRLNVSQQAPKKKKKLVQMQLDLVAEPNKTCKACGMEYVPSLAEDAALHRKFHAMNVGGVDISKAICERLRQTQVWSGGQRSFIAVVGRRDALALRNKAREVLKIVNTELGAVPIPDEALWSQTRNPILPNKSIPEGAEDQPQSSRTGSDRYKVYLYIQGAKCVGACLAERIQEAYPVLGPDGGGDAAAETAGQLPAGDANSSSSISISEARRPAMLGISRIWTSSAHRQRGIATTLLDSARSHFLYGMTVRRDQVAFSQPTESGGRLARKWSGRAAGWLVYID